MMRIVLAAYALCAALVLMIGVGGTAPAEAGYYRYGYHGGGYDRGYRGYGIRSGYYGGRGYYDRRAYYGGRGYYRGYDSGYRTTYYDRPAYRSGCTAIHDYYVLWATPAAAIMAATRPTFPTAGAGTAHRAADTRQTRFDEPTARESGPLRFAVMGKTASQVFGVKP